MSIVEGTPVGHWLYRREKSPLDIVQMLLRHDSGRKLAKLGRAARSTVVMFVPALEHRPAGLLYVNLGGGMNLNPKP